MRYDVAILGAGFAGAILARALHREGFSVALIERGAHPRFSLGESSTPLAALSLERLAARCGLPDLDDLAAYGRWTKHLPDLRRGKKRGFSFFHHRPRQPFANTEANEARLLVAASPNDAIADAHWLRADVDHHLVARAVNEGVRYLDRTVVDRVELGGARVRIEGSRAGEQIGIEATTVVDGTGPAAVVAHAAGLTDRTDAMSVRSGLLYAHLERVLPFADRAQRDGASLPAGPFPDDQAAVHHLLEEGWMYQLRFDHGITSVGLLIEDARPVPDLLPAEAVDRIVARYPTLAAQMADARAVVPWRFIRRIQHRWSHAAGPGFFLLPHTFTFVDPMFSTGMAWSLIAVERLVDILTGRHGDAATYDTLLGLESDAIEHLIAGAYCARFDFARFCTQSFLYFAAVSFEEAHQRLIPTESGQTPDAWRGFLGVHEPDRRTLFAEALARLTDAPGDQDTTRRFAAWVAEKIAPFDIGGFFKPSRHNLHPLDLDVLVDRAALLGLDRTEVLSALPRLRGDASNRRPKRRGVS